MCMMCSLNIVIVSNTQAGIICDNVRLWEKIDFIEEDAPTIYLYYHLHKKPFTPSKILNHYGYLFAYDGSNPEGFEIYRNRMTSQPSMIDLLRDGGEKDDAEHPPPKRSKQKKQTHIEKQKCCDVLKTIKDKKQSVLTQFLTRMKIDKVVQKLE